MSDSLRILSARRAFEFAPDELRLTVLTNASFLQHFQAEFDFGEAAIDRPSQTFGPVPETSPPGLVFAYGSVKLGAMAVPIRYIHFEAQRIVIDVAGPSESIVPIYRAIRSMLEDAKAPDGHPVLGDPIHTLDYSDLVMRLDLGPTAALMGEIGRLYVEASGESGDGEDLIAVPRWDVHVRPVDAPFHPVPAHQQFRLALRPGTAPTDCRFVSGAPLDTDAHQAFLERLEASFAPGKPSRKRAKGRR